VNTMDDKDFDYTAYVVEHVGNVQIVWEEVSKRCKGEHWLDDFYYFTIKSLIEHHDESKYSADEFQGYRQWFFPEEGDKKSQARFDFAWNHHQKHNPHHWQYWLMWKPKGTIVLNMPFPYVFEMLCDWSAMSLAFDDTPSEFYEKNNDGMFLADNTRMCIERHLPLFDESVEAIRHIHHEPTGRSAKNE